LEVSDLERRQVAERRRDEPWFPDAFAAFERIWAGSLAPADWTGITPFTYGRWNTAARDHAARESSQKNQEAARVYYSDGALDPQAMTALLAQARSQVLLLAGEYDVVLPPNRAARYAELFPHCELVVQPGAGHFPWLDDPTLFVRILAEHLA
jgi:pimeloyl-ACP methyl ester carboxylesterase